MRRHFGMVICATFALTGCATHAQSGALGGAAVGGIVGGVAGGGTGAAIGIGAGALTGALIGSIIDEQEARRVNRNTRRRLERGEQLSVENIVDLLKADISESKIEQLITRTDSRYDLSRYDIEALKKAGASASLISYMQSRRY